MTSACSRPLCRLPGDALPLQWREWLVANAGHCTRIVEEDQAETHRLLNGQAQALAALTLMPLTIAVALLRLRRICEALSRCASGPEVACWFDVHHWAPFVDSAACCTVFHRFHKFMPMPWRRAWALLRRNLSCHLVALGDGSRAMIEALCYVHESVRDDPHLTRRIAHLCTAIRSGTIPSGTVPRLTYLWSFSEAERLRIDLTGDDHVDGTNTVSLSREKGKKRQRDEEVSFSLDALPESAPLAMPWTPHLSAAQARRQSDRHAANIRMHWSSSSLMGWLIEEEMDSVECALLPEMQRLVLCEGVGALQHFMQSSSTDNATWQGFMMCAADLARSIWTGTHEEVYPSSLPPFLQRDTFAQLGRFMQSCPRLSAEEDRDALRAWRRHLMRAENAPCLLLVTAFFGGSIMAEGSPTEEVAEWMDQCDMELAIECAS